MPEFNTIVLGHKTKSFIHGVPKMKYDIDHSLID